MFFSPYRYNVELTQYCTDIFSLWRYLGGCAALVLVTVFFTTLILVFDVPVFDVLVFDVLVFDVLVVLLTVAVLLKLGQVGPGLILRA